MKFLCRRTSLGDQEGQNPTKQPHHWAELEPTSKPTWWMDDELDYQEDPDGKRWFINLTYASLVDLIRKEGKVVIAKDDDFPDMLSLEIYDDYRE